MLASSQSFLLRRKVKCLYCYIYYAVKEDNLQSAGILGGYFRYMTPPIRLFIKHISILTKKVLLRNTVYTDRLEHAARIFRATFPLC